jgi:hypothetical protein
MYARAPAPKLTLRPRDLSWTARKSASGVEVATVAQAVPAANVWVV